MSGEKLKDAAVIFGLVLRLLPCACCCDAKSKFFGVLLLCDAKSKFGQFFGVFFVARKFLLGLVKSMLDPCEDENDDIQDDDVSLGADFVQRDENSESVSEISSRIVMTMVDMVDEGDNNP
ncbi:Meiosis-specific protein ASY1 [Camellia lanceoleosa]|nr:Meiosis-specific protein ASY1 [Camellia lanceoleosa]